MEIPSCGTACFQHAHLYFAFWAVGTAAGLVFMVTFLNRMFVPPQAG